MPVNLVAVKHAEWNKGRRVQKGTFLNRHSTNFPTSRGTFQSSPRLWAISRGRPRWDRSSESTASSIISASSTFRRVIAVARRIDSPPPRFYSIWIIFSFQQVSKFFEFANLLAIGLYRRFIIKNYSRIEDTFCWYLVSRYYYVYILIVKIYLYNICVPLLSQRYSVYLVYMRMIRIEKQRYYNGVIRIV